MPADIANQPPIGTTQKLDKKVTAARPNMTPTKERIYANEETGTVIYCVLTSNSALPENMKGGSPLYRFESITWGYFLVGNENGYAESDVYVASEASFRLGKITEDDEKVTIERQGKQTIHFGIEVEVGNIVLKKKDFKPYDD